jgi:PAS domain S-box-containing protein
MSAPGLTDELDDPNAYANNLQRQEAGTHSQVAQRLAIQYAVTRILAEAATLAEATPGMLQTIAQIAGWDVGVVWAVDRAADMLRCVDTWHRAGGDFCAFEEATRSLRFAQADGLPGKVWAAQEPVWIENLVQHNPYRRSAAAHACGLRGAFVFPALFRGEVTGVLGFYSGQIERPDQELLRMVGALGSQIGQFLERKRTEEELHRSRERFEVAVQGSGDGIWDWDLKTNQVYFSPHWKAQLGYADDELSNAYEEWESRLHPEDRQRVLTALWDYLEGRRPTYEPELRLRHRDGSYRWILARAAALRRLDGVPYRLAGSHTDITVRKQTEEELRQARENLEHLVRQRTAELAEANVALRRVNRAMRALSCCNQALIRASDEGDLLQEVCRIIVAVAGYRLCWVGYAEHDEAKTVRPMAQAGHEEGYLQTVRVTWADSERGWGPTGTPIRTRQPAVFQDVRADPRFAPWRAEALKRGYASVLGVPLLAGNDVLGSVAIYASEPDAFDPEEVRLLQSLANDLAFGIMALRTRAEHAQAVGALQKAHDELERRVTERTAALQQANDRLTQEVSERQHIEEELRQAKEAAEAASRAKSGFLAAMSHEIRTPMNGIMGMTDLALDTDLTAQQREYLELVKKSSDALLAMINDVLDFSKIEAGKLDLDSAPFSLREGLGDLLALLAVRAHQKGLELACHVAPDVPDGLVGDLGRLRQVLINLVGNAIKFTEHGEVVVDVAVVGRQEGAAALRFAVCDTGIGIPADKLSSLFQPFVQVDGSLTRQYEGTGLGLAICSRLVEMMGGRITAESKLGKGSCFRFTVSLQLRPDAGKRLVPAEPAQLGGLRVLVVDDNTTSTRILEEMLSHWGLRPTAVDSGPAALAALEGAHQAGQPFHLALLDAHMPEMDGFTLAETIRRQSQWNEPRILMLSSAGPMGGTNRARSAGVVDLLVKPVRHADLCQAILRAMGATVHAGQPTAERPTPAGRPLRILLAEDNPVNQKVAVGLLEKQGHTVTVAGNGREALTALYPADSLANEDRGLPFDVVLMDVQMPEMDGLRATAAIRQRERVGGEHLPIIAMTAYALKGDRERCLEAGMDGYVSKPIRRAELLEALQAVVPARAEPAAPPPAEAAAPKPLDVTAALEELLGDQKLLTELAGLFLAECPRWVAEIHAAVACGDARRLQLAAHSLKGAVTSFVARDASEAALRLEKMGRSGDLSAAAGAVAALVQEVERLRPALTALAEQAAAPTADRPAGPG